MPEGTRVLVELAVPADLAAPVEKAVMEASLAAEAERAPLARLVILETRGSLGGRLALSLNEFPAI